MKTFRVFPHTLFLLPALAWLTGCFPEDERARVLVYSPHGKEMLGAYEELFEARHPGVDIAWIDMGGQDAYDRIRTERQNPQAQRLVGRRRHGVRPGGPGGTARSVCAILGRGSARSCLRGGGIHGTAHF